jgi:hypothetical protein
MKKQIFLISYRGFGKEYNFLRGSFNVNVFAKNRVEAIASLEKDVKSRFPKIESVIIDSCLSKDEQELIDRAVSHLNQKRNGVA